MTHPPYPVQSVGDMIDKLSILSRKIYFGEEKAYEEHNYLVKGLETLGFDGELLAATIRLSMMNTEIWNLENDIRKGGEGKYSLDEIGRRAIEIRNLNRKRVDYKNDINALVGGFREVKVNHASQ